VTHVQQERNTRKLYLFFKATKKCLHSLSQARLMLPNFVHMIISHLYCYMNVGLLFA